MSVDVETLARQCSSVASVDSDDLDEYEVLQRLGAGGFGEACRVRNKFDKREYVMKIIHTNTEEDATATMKEMIAMKACRSPYTVRFEKLFKQDKDFYLLMEFCSEGDLFGRIVNSVQTQQPLTEDQILRWFTQIAMGLKAIHDKGLIHRDLKPSNVFFSRWDVAKLGDFGLATQGARKTRSNTPGDLANKFGTLKKAGDRAALAAAAPGASVVMVRESREVVNGIAGTPGFIAPEALQGKPYNAKCDIWALGCILYEMLTARSAFADLFRGNLESTQPVPMSELTGPNSFALGPNSRAAKLYSSEIRNLLIACLDPNPATRPTINEILARPELANAVKQVEAERELLEKVADFESRLGYDGNARAQRLLEARFLPQYGALRALVRAAGASYSFGCDCIVYFRNTLYWLWTALSKPEDLPYVRRKLEADSELTDPQTRAVIAGLVLVLFPLLLAVLGLFVGVATSLVFKYWRIFLITIVVPPLLLFLIKVSERATRDAIVAELRGSPPSDTPANENVLQSPSALAPSVLLASPTTVAKAYPFLPWTHLTQFCFFLSTIIITLELLNLQGAPGESRWLHLGFGGVALLAGAVAYWLALTYRSGSDADPVAPTNPPSSTKPKSSPRALSGIASLSSPQVVQVFGANKKAPPPHLRGVPKGRQASRPLEDSDSEAAAAGEEPNERKTINLSPTSAHSSENNKAGPTVAAIDASIDTEDFPVEAAKPGTLEDLIHRKRQQTSADMLRNCSLLSLGAVNVALFFMLNTYYSISSVTGESVKGATLQELTRNNSFLTFKTFPLLIIFAAISYNLGAMFKRVPSLEATFTTVFRTLIHKITDVVSLALTKAGLKRGSVVETSIKLFASSADKFMSDASGPLISCILLKALMICVMMFGLISSTVHVSSRDMQASGVTKGKEFRQTLSVALFSPFFFVPDVIFISLATFAHSLKLSPNFQSYLRYGLVMCTLFVFILPFCFSFATVLMYW